MPRGQKEGDDLDGGSQAPVERSRRALGDVSNKESKDTKEGASKKREGQTLRRSRRLSAEASDPSEPDLSQPTQTEEAATVPIRHSLRSSAARASVNPFAEPIPAKRVVRKRTSKVVEQEKSSTVASTGIKRPLEASFDGPSPRKCTKKRGTIEIVENVDDVTHVPTKTGRNLCNDILTTTDYGLQRIPFSARQFTEGVAHYDEEYKDDILHVPNYVTDIYQRLFNAEENTRPKPYMEKTKQPELNGMMRSILVDWLVEVHMKFRLLPETLYLCVNIIDRYLERQAVNRNRLQLVGVTALLIACKYEEIYPPEVKDCVYITDRAYTRQDVLDMEAEIVKTLQFYLTVPTGHPFLQRFLHIIKASSLVRNLANYYMERMLQEHSALEYKPSLLAAAAVCLALNNPTRLERDEYLSEGQPNEVFPTLLLQYTGFSKSEIKDAAKLMEAKVGEIGATVRSRQLIAVKRKYQSTRYESVAGNFTEPKACHLDEPQR